MRSSLLVVCLAACAQSAPAVQTRGDYRPKLAAAGPDFEATCVAAFERQRACTDTFIPRLVDARVRHDQPPGLAEKDRSEGREALVAQALEEWKVDSTDDAIRTVCGRMTTQVPPEQQEALRPRVEACLEAAECSAFVDCILPIVEEQLAR